MLVLVALCACDSGMRPDDRLAHEGTVHAATVTFAIPPSLPPPPPPPPPPPAPTLMPPPPEIADFLRGHANDPAPWQVTIYELDGKETQPLFMGAHVGQQRVLGRGASVAAVTRLAQPHYYLDGDVGGFVTSVGIRIARGPATLDLVYNAGHLFLTPAWHEGRFVVLTDGQWLEDLL